MRSLVHAGLLWHKRGKLSSSHRRGLPFDDNGGLYLIRTRLRECRPIQTVRTYMRTLDMFLHLQHIYEYMILDHMIIGGSTSEKTVLLIEDSSEDVMLMEHACRRSRVPHHFEFV